MNSFAGVEIAVDAVVFGYHAENGLSVLLTKRKKQPFKDQWALPGGFVKKEESLETAVLNRLKEKANIEIAYLEQLYTFGEPKRDPRTRIISVVYYCLVRTEAYDRLLKTSETQWFNISKLPELAFDHDKILEVAISRLRSKITYQPIGFDLLNQEFKLTELQQLYETIYGREIDRRNFNKKILSLDILRELKVKYTGMRGRPGKLYSFDKNRYLNLTKEGFVFDCEF